eukprot:CAMPEP_0195155872 /NCGR_PEP_ID=MMETSP0448-20130528/184378_1 /TAXON_ID=66468 /ORGANISM="Heterocapsa triquestra, Strain CCMP 448" /LENGTH=588 /DNA_ID=CAMNT_0040194661 /DNA_START=82 /DNA_END=1851 /DNA_ORIENTATION=+
MAFDMKSLAKMGVNVETFGDINAFGDPAWYQAFNTPGYYNDTHKKLRALVRDFIETEVMGNVHEWDEDHKIPQEVYQKAAKIGLLPIAVGRPWPNKFVGECPLGFEPDYFHELIVFDEMARCGSGGFMWGLAGGLCIGLPPVLKWAAPEVKSRVVPQVLRAEKVICLAITEPTAGSDVANLRATAVKEGDHYIVNGEKKWITNGIFADYFTVAVRTGSQKDGMKGLSLQVDHQRHLRGLLHRGGAHRLGEGRHEGTQPPAPREDDAGRDLQEDEVQRSVASGTTFITFDNVKVPVTNLLGKEGKGFQLIMNNFNHERFGICAMTNRFSRVCMEDSLKFASKRKTFGKALIQHDVIRWKLAEMARMIESTHCWLEFITFQLNTMHHQEATMKLGGHTALLKVQCTKVFEFCAREASQIFGGLSYTRGGQGEKVERLSREVRAMAVPGGSEEVMLDLGIRQSKKLADMAQAILGAQPQAQQVMLDLGIRQSKKLADMAQAILGAQPQAQAKFEASPGIWGPRAAPAMRGSTQKGAEGIDCSGRVGPSSQTYRCRRAQVQRRGRLPFVPCRAERDHNFLFAALAAIVPGGS